MIVQRHLLAQFKFLLPKAPIGTEQSEMSVEKGGLVENRPKFLRKYCLTKTRMFYIII